MITLTSMKRNITLVSYSVLVLIAFMCAGLLVVNFYGSSEYVVSLPDKNYVSLLVWRVILYTSIYCGWRPLVNFKLKKQNTPSDEIKRYAINSRHKVVLLAIFYELIFVQNIFQILFSGFN
jgi:hypothetical protein